METSLTSALIIRRSPGVAVCRPEKHTHMWLWCKATHAQSRQDGASSRGGKSLVLLANSNNHKITFLLSLSYTKRQVFFPSSAPSSFFLLRSAAHNSEHYMMAALKHWSGFRAGQDSTPQCTLCWILHWSQLSDCGRREDASTPFLFSRQEAEWFKVFPSLFTLSTLTSFFHFLSFSVIQNFPCGLIAPIFWEHYSSYQRWPVWNPTSWAMHSLRLCLILARLGW